MGSYERKLKEKEIRRNDIIEAAERVFFAKGYDHATMDDVAKEAEFSKRTVYMYFNSKEQIYFEVMTRGYRQLIAMLKEDMESKAFPDAIEEIKQMSLTLYLFSQRHPDYFKAIIEYENGEFEFQKGVSDQSREKCYELGEKIMGDLISILKKGIAEGTLRANLDAEKTALVLWACVIGVYSTADKKKHYIKNYYGIAAEELITESLGLIIRSIQAGNEGNAQ